MNMLISTVGLKYIFPEAILFIEVIVVIVVDGGGMEFIITILILHSGLIDILEDQFAQLHDESLNVEHNVILFVL